MGGNDPVAGSWTWIKIAIKALGRVLVIFAQLERPSGALTEITRHLGYPRSSASVLLKSVVAQGSFEYDRKSSSKGGVSDAGLASST